MFILFHRGLGAHLFDSLETFQVPLRRVIFIFHFTSEHRTFLVCSLNIYLFIELLDGVSNAAYLLSPLSVDMLRVLLLAQHENIREVLLDRLSVRRQIMALLTVSVHDYLRQIPLLCITRLLSVDHSIQRNLLVLNKRWLRIERLNLIFTLLQGLYCLILTNQLSQVDVPGHSQIVVGEGDVFVAIFK